MTFHRFTIVTFSSNNFILLLGKGCLTLLITPTSKLKVNAKSFTKYFFYTFCYMMYTPSSTEIIWYWPIAMVENSSIYMSIIQNDIFLVYQRVFQNCLRLCHNQVFGHPCSFRTETTFLTKFTYYAYIQSGFVIGFMNILVQKLSWQGFLILWIGMWFSVW